MKMIPLCILIATASPLLSAEQVPFADLSQYGAWGIVALMLFMLIKQHGRAVEALSESVATQRRVADALEQHMREDAAAFERLHETILALSKEKS